MVMMMMNRMRKIKSSFVLCVWEVPILKLPNFQMHFVLRTDASDGGLGAVLLQEQDVMDMPVM